MDFITDGGRSFAFPALPTRLVFGFGTLSSLAEQVALCSASRPLVVTDPGVGQAGILDRVLEQLKRASIEPATFDEVPQDSSTRSVSAALERLRSHRANVVIGVGGGSALDTAKAVALSATNEGPITDYVGLGKLSAPGLPVIAIPTTAGTGSEVSFWSVLTDDATQAKVSVGGQEVFPKVALCDPELTLTLPPALTASTGMDALTHAIESFTNTATQPLSQLLAHQAVYLIGKYLRTAATNGRDRESRYGMMLASTLAGIAMNPTRLGIAHALAMPLGSWTFKVPHGVANAILLPHVMAYNVPANLRAFKQIAEALGENTTGLNDREAAYAAVSAIQVILQDVGIENRLGDYGITENALPQIVEEAMKSGNIVVNPRLTTTQDVTEIAKRAL